MCWSTWLLYLLEGTSELMDQTCKICKQRNKFDFYVANDDWLRVLSDRSELVDHVICLSCFDDIAAKKNVRFDLLGPLYFTGDAMNLSFNLRRGVRAGGLINVRAFES